MTIINNIKQTLEDHTLTYHMDEDEIQELATSIANNMGVSLHEDAYPDWSE